MKIKMTKAVTAFNIIIATAFMCFGIYYVVDTVWNGSFVDWFSRNYMISHTSSEDIQQSIPITEPNWPKLKILLLTILIVLVIVIVTTIISVAYFHSKAKVTQSITAASQMIHSYMTGKQEFVDVFPKEYAEITAQMVEIKSTMQRHEQIMQEEAARKNDLVAYLAHDLKTPLTSVIGYLNLLDEAPDMPDSQKEKYIHIAMKKASRLEKLINEFFEITRYNLQQIELQTETIDLYYMFVQMADEFYPLLTTNGNTIQLQLDEDMTICGDSIKLARVFNNILKNAISYSYPNTIIKINGRNTGKETHIYFINEGKTIPKQKLHSIFEKFFRLDEARATNTGGAGLGLAIAKEIIILHGGSITASSDNELTSFCVTFPSNTM